MAAVRSARGGDRYLCWHDWVIGWGVVWLLPVPLGGLMLSSFLFWGWLSEGLDRTLPFGDALANLAQTGMVVALMPMLSWLGLLPLMPMVWLALRLGFGGWVSFALGGIGCGLLADLVLVGYPPAIPLGAGLASALALRALLGWRRPAAFDPGAGDGR